MLNADLLWIFGTGQESFTGWNAFMGKLTEHMPYRMSKVICLPFVNASPNDVSTIYSVLKYSVQNTSKYKISNCFVTFDQPLYQKAVEVVKSRCEEDVGKVHIQLVVFTL